RRLTSYPGGPNCGPSDVTAWSLIAVKPYGRWTVKMATSSIAAIGTLTTTTNAPSSTASPPSSSIRIVDQAMTVGAGTPRACRIPMKTSGPLLSFAKPCAMKPYPTIRRSGIGTQRAMRDRSEDAPNMTQDTVRRTSGSPRDRDQRWLLFILCPHRMKSRAIPPTASAREVPGRARGPRPWTAFDPDRPVLGRSRRGSDRRASDRIGTGRDDGPRRAHLDRLPPARALRRRPRRLHRRDPVRRVRSHVPLRGVAAAPADGHVLAPRLGGVPPATTAHTQR